MQDPVIACRMCTWRCVRARRRAGRQKPGLAPRLLSKALFYYKHYDYIFWKLNWSDRIQTWNPKINATLLRIQLFHHQSARVSHLYWAFIPWFTLSINQFLNNTYYLFRKLNWSDRDMQQWTSHCGFLVLGNTQKILTEIWHQFWDKKDGENICHLNFFTYHERYQSYQLTGPANSDRKAG